MSDSDKTNELDNYGVWVKKPPRTVSSEIGEENTDFSPIDVMDNAAEDTVFNADETALSKDELANIAGLGTFEETAPEQTESAVSGETEEISLDEFIEGGVFEGDEDNASSQPASSQEEEAVSQNTFETSSDITVSDTPSVSDAPVFADEGPIDIDLSFDDADTSSSTSEASGFASSSVEQVPGSEDVDLSDFGLDFSDSGSSGENAAAPSDDGTESVDLSDFGVDFSDDAASPVAESSTDSSESSQASSTSDDGTEEISLDSFGFDINAEEPSEPAQNKGDTDSSSQGSEDETISLSSQDSLDARNDDVGNISLDLDTSDQKQEESPAPSSFAAPDDDDFDLDSIMDSIQDENGNTTSLNDESSSLLHTAESIKNEEKADISEESFASDSVTEQISDEAFSPALTDETEESESATEPVIDSPLPDFGTDTFEIENPSSETAKIETENFTSEPIFSESDNFVADTTIPETEASEPESFAAEMPSFESESIESEPVEDSGSIDVVDMEEPVFEETAVDIADETPIESPVETQESEIEAEKENPFTLPPDDAFTARVTEEPTILEENNIVEKVPFDSQTSEPEISFEQDSSASEEPTFDVQEPTFETHDNPEISEGFEPETQGTNEEVKQDEEISSAANNILNQIASELSSLRNEISNLKSEFEELKNKEPQKEEEESVSLTEENASSGGFFGDQDEDETIALSLDEMDNILNTAEIVEEKAPETPSFEENADESAEESTQTEQSDEALDFTNENIEEPVLDDIDTNIAEDELPDEILVPKADDLVVESSSNNLIEEESSPSDDKTMVDEPFVFDEAESKSPVAEVAEETEERKSDDVSIKENELDDLLASEAALAEQNKKYIEEDKQEVQSSIPNNLQKEIKSVLSYMDQLLENLPEEKIAEFAQSEQFETYKKLFKELGLD